MTANTVNRAPRLLKKAELLKLLNLSRTTFEKQVSEGTFPQPFMWVTANPRGRRWHADDIQRVFGIDLSAA